MSDPIDRLDTLKAIEDYFNPNHNTDELPAPLTEFLIAVGVIISTQPEDDRLERCRFEYINACKIVARPTPDTSKSDIYDAYAVIKALHPIFGDVEF